MSNNITHLEASQILISISTTVTTPSQNLHSSIILPPPTTTTVPTSSPIIHSTKSSSHITDNDRKKILLKYNKLLEKGNSKMDAANKLECNIRTLQKWNKKLSKKVKKAKFKQHRKSQLDHIEAELIKFINTETKERCHPVKNRVVMKKAIEMCNLFKEKTIIAQQQLIHRFMKKAQAHGLIDLPPRGKSTSDKVRHKMVACSFINEYYCVDNCRKNDNCSYKRINKNMFKNTKIVECDERGKGLVILENCYAGDFVIEYFGKTVPPKELKQTGGKGHYYLRLGPNNIINGDIKKNDAKYINHSCDPNCELKLVVDLNENKRACIIALKRIRINTDITIDYQWECKVGEQTTPCLCGTIHTQHTIERLIK